jgi:23S rRNA (adenine2503-C2)-methyltransferase
MKRLDLKDLTLEELKKAVLDLGEPGYRALQLSSWIYKRGISDPETMSNIPLKLREKLFNHYYLSCPEISGHQKSIDGTEKFLFKLFDGKFIESVLIGSEDRRTLCLSTQVGCKIGCRFCASGKGGFKRNLSSAEILNQVLHAKETAGSGLTNYVFMGMGEPLENYENLTKALVIMNHDDGIKIGARRITVSTCGIIPGIERLSTLGLQINLSLSLHATEDRLRSSLIPVNRKYPIKDLIEACDKFRKSKNRVITLEYLILKGINDTRSDSKRLASIANSLGAKINLIQYSPVRGAGFPETTHEEALIFEKCVRRFCANVTVRESKGKDIAAACGQLAGRSA